jgi:hypothetical protein
LIDKAGPVDVTTPVTRFSLTLPYASPYPSRRIELSNGRWRLYIDADVQRFSDEPIPSEVWRVRLARRIRVLRHERAHENAKTPTTFLSR